MEGLIFEGAYLTEGNLRFKLDWASLIVGSKFTVFAHCFTLYLRAIFQVQAPGCLYLEGDLTEGFLRYRFGGLIFGGAYTWRGLFSEFYGNRKYQVYEFTGTINHRFSTNQNARTILVIL